jgi:L-ascorbate metabolism protein UlaG (beta-lactamase superfamily)
MTLEKNGQLLVIDPGVYTEDLPADLRGVAATVVTHEHPDHFDPPHLTRLARANPGMPVITVRAVADRLPPGVVGQAVESGARVQAGPYALTFYGSTHARVAPGMPAVPCLGVMVDQTLAYAGDAFPAPPQVPAAVAVPVAGAWLSGEDVIEYVQTLRAGVAFPVHEALASERGLNLLNAAVASAAEAASLRWQVLAPGESIEL